MKLSISLLVSFALIWGAPAMVVLASEQDVIVADQMVTTQATQESESAALDVTILQPSVQTPTVQETFNTQEGANTELLSNDAEVEIVLPAPDPEEVTPIEEHNPSEEQPATSQPEQSSAEEVTESQTEELPEGQLTEESQQEQPQIEQMLPEIQISKPKSIYTFSLGTRTIPTKKKIAQRVVRSSNESGALRRSVNDTKNNAVDEIVETSIANSLNPILDNETGEITLSGQCSSMYFVVLVYKNESDYSDNQSSYIFNKAFECQNNSFSYAIKDLPTTLKDGAYYILIGEQGEIGTWTPASALTEINLNRR